jgi:hypothetical protein
MSNNNKKQEIKDKLRPIVKECIMEMLLEDGLLSNIISECVAGVVSKQELVMETRQQSVQQMPQVRQASNTLFEGEREEIKRRKKEFIESMGMLKGAFDDIDEKLEAQERAKRNIVSNQSQQQQLNEVFPPQKVSKMNVTESIADPTRSMDPTDPGINMEKIFDPAVINAWRKADYRRK